MTKTKWNIDPTHSEVQFKVKHLVISTVSGQFSKFEGSLETEGDDFDGASASFQLDVNSVNTNVVDRDTHLKSADFFSAEQFPYIKFSNGKLNKAGDDYKLKGDLTIKDITRPITLDVEYGGSMVDGYGQNKAGFEVNGKINRKEFGLVWNMVTEAGGVVVGDEVKLQLNIQVVKA
ncbi:YceI family protein [Marivirga sp. S37H4]|uniref:YceI family protein n=1 Tax=Marivirga aurantiaca TaxID=2802615 RepID=A0A935C6Q5_9BACT|nr:YceI family protein [Marivirga aurantiaca]MBK6264505.1 YceI family protein [Marivirga aurantiaca]